MLAKEIYEIASSHACEEQETVAFTVYDHSIDREPITDDEDRTYFSLIAVVPRKWIAEEIAADGSALDEWLKEYTSEESVPMFEAAILQDKIVAVNLL